MIGYTHYSRRYIIMTEKNNAFLYFSTKRDVTLHSLNFGKGKDHWFEYLGCFTIADCQAENPLVCIYPIKDETLSKFLRDKVRELENFFIEG